MALLEKHLTVKTSSLPGSGKGLFTKKFIPKGTRIVEYKGKVSTWKEVEHNEGTNGYIYYVNRKHAIDASKHKKALARYVNDAKGIQKVKGIRNNADYVEVGVKVFVKAIVDIPEGSEIFVQYGKEYWDVMRYNKKLEEKENKNRTKPASKTSR
jgi:SET domain-containing protein